VRHPRRNGPPAPRKRPRLPVAFHAAMLVLAVLGLLTGIVDVAIPFLTGGAPFSLLFALTEAFGPGYLLAHIVVHNLGLACVVPGIAFLAMAKEKDRDLRRAIPWILFFAVALSVVSGVHYLFDAGLYKGPSMLPVIVLEVGAVLGLALAGFLAYRDFVPTPAIGWSLVVPTRRLVPVFALASASLLLAGALEVRALGAI